MSKRSHGGAETALHRRVFGDLIVVNGGGDTPPTSVNVTYWGGGNTSYLDGSSPKLELGMRVLPRRQGYVWAAEILRINYQFNDLYSGVDGAVNFMIAVAVTGSNAAPITTFMNANVGPANMWRLDPVLDVGTYEVRYMGATAMGIYPPRADGQHIEHDLTDLNGRGVVVFSDCLYAFFQRYMGNVPGSAGPNISCAIEVFFRYVQVPLETYLSTQEDLAKSGV